MTRTLFLGVMLWSLFVGTAGAVFTPASYEARRTNTPPTIDGDLTEGVWSQAQVIDKFFVYQSGGTLAKSTGTMRLLWDSDYLYLGMAMDDVNILPASVTKGISGHDSAIYEGDVIEFFVKEKGSSPRYHEFEWNARGDDFDARFDSVRFGSPGTKWESGMSSVAKYVGTLDNKNDVDQGYTVEVKIPLASFDPIQVGTIWNFTFARYDYFPRTPSGYRSDLMMTTRGDSSAPNGGVTHGFHTYEIYDRLEFVGVPEPASGSAVWLFGGCWLGRRWLRRTSRRFDA